MTPDLMKNIYAANAEFITEDPIDMPNEAASEEPMASLAPVDVYQEQKQIQNDYAKKRYPKGARNIVLATVKDVVEGAGTASLARAYKRARDDSESLKERGEDVRAQLIVNQYMQDHFLPAVEVVVNFTSPDELLNSKEALRILDKYALGVGAMTGYTATYVREAYAAQLGQIEQASSPTVTHGVARLNGLLDTDQVQAAKAYARRLKKMIDDGKTISSSIDYDLISRVATNE